MLRHAISPARNFTQVLNELIRHPRLNSDAFRLLSWQLSLPAHAKESLSKSAERAGIKKCAFLKAKRQLKDEGYLHEWREQGLRGLWKTQQLVSSVPLTPAEAAAARAALDPAVGTPAVGDPAGRVGGRHPGKHREENTSIHREAEPPEPAPEPQPDPAPELRPPSDVGLQLAYALHYLDRRLVIPQVMFPRLAHLADRWLAAGHTTHDIREHIRRCLPANGGQIHRPGGLMVHILRNMPPTWASQPRVVPRVFRMRECEGEHTQALIFMPMGDEEYCRDCQDVRMGAGAVLTSL
ncbi:hypothetical protein [Streptomyces sp. NPDC050738]|uniref:hypothetical protein n=1 Tax=Streptomyces sp. NPDC050738 TaxID=3154744 RepID=UPI00341D0533